MALSDVGVIFVSKGFADFMSNMSKASQTISNFSNLAQDRLKALQMYNDAMVKTAKYARDIAVSNDRLVISQQRTAQANAKLKTTQAQVAVSANQAKVAQANFSKSFNDVAISANKTAVALKRLEVIDKLNDAMIAGTISSEDYATGLNGINYAASRMSSSLNQSMDAMSVLQNIGGMLGGSISSLGNMGATIGGVIGTIFPGIGNMVGAIAGYILGAIAGLGVGIVKSIFSIAENIGKAILNVGKKIFNTVVNVFKSIINGVKSFLGEIFNLLTGGIFKSGWNNLGNTIVSSMFKFEILRGIIRKIANEIRSLSDAAFQGAIAFQQLDARLKFLIRMQIKSTDSTMSLAKATELAGEQARQLEFWIAKTALQSPVSVDEVAETVSLSIAMGWAVDAAKELTSAIVDYTSATGLGKETAERIIYNFAQMKQQGKVTGTELRDLGRGAFMPVNKILEIMYNDLKKVNDEMGASTMSFAQFREEAAAGKIDVEGFFKAFEEFVNLNMAGAAYEMNYTFAAVADNLKDLFKIFLGWNVLGPLIKSVTEPLQNFIERMSTDEALLAANRIGKALAFAVEYVKKGLGELFRVIGLFFKMAGFAAPSIKEIVMTVVQLGRAFYYVSNIIATFIKNALNPLATAIRKKFGEPMTNMRKNFFEWGAGLVVSFAKGMIQAASRVLTSVMNFIASILKGWLKGHSPPKILPDIDQWGMDTINEWLHGFTQGDFSILEDVQSSIKDALGALVDFGLMTEQESAQEYLHLTTSLIQAMDELNRTGTISEGIFEELASLSNVYGTEIAELLRLELQYAEELKKQEAYELAVAEATRIAEEAQKAYDDAVKATQVSTQKTSRLIREYNNMLRRGADKQQLKNKLKIVNASYQEMLTNQKAEEQKKTQLEIAEEQLKLAEDALKAFQESLKPLQDQIDLQKSLIKQLTDLARAQKETEESAKSTGDALEDIADALGDIGSGFTWEDPWVDSDLQGWIDEANANFDDWVKNKLPGLWGDAWNANFVDPESPFQKALSGLWDQLVPSFEKVTGLLKAAWDDFADYMELPSWEELLGAYESGEADRTYYGGGTEEGIGWQPGGILAGLRNVLQTLADSIPEDKTIGDILAKVGSYILTKIGNLISKFATDPTKMAGISTAVNSVVEWMRKVFMGEETGGAGKPPITVLSEALTKLLISAGSNMLTAIAPGQPIYNTLVSVGTAIADGIISGIENGIETWWENYKSTWSLGNIGIRIGNLFLPENYDVPYMTPTAVNPEISLQPIYNPPLTTVGSDAISYLFPTGTTTILTPTMSISPVYDPTLAATGEDIITGIGSGADGKVKSFGWSDIWKVIWNSLTSYWDNDSPSERTKAVGVDIIDGLSEGIESQIKATTWKDIWQSIVDTFMKLFGIASPNAESTVYKGFGVDSINGLSRGLINQIAITTWKDIWQSIVNTFMKLFGITAPGSDSTVFKGFGVDTINGLKTGFVNTVNTIIGTGGAIPSAISSIIEKVKSVFGLGGNDAAFRGIGKGIVQDFMNGLDAMAGAVKNKATAIFQPIIDLIEKIFGIKSPSSVFYDIAVNVSKGFINGIESWADRVAAKMKELYQKYIMPPPGVGGPPGHGPPGHPPPSEPIPQPPPPHEPYIPLGFPVEQPGLEEIIAQVQNEQQNAINDMVIQAQSVQQEAVDNMWLIGSANNAMQDSIAKNISNRIVSKENGTNVYSGNTVYFGDVHINNDMDWAVFKSQVQRAIIEA